MSFVKLDKYYVNIDYIAVVEDTGETFNVLFDVSTRGLPTSVQIKKKSDEGVDLIKAMQDRTLR